MIPQYSKGTYNVFITSEELNALSKGSRLTADLVETDTRKDLGKRVSLEVGEVFWSWADLNTRPPFSNWEDTKEVGLTLHEGANQTLQEEGRFREDFHEGKLSISVMDHQKTLRQTYPLMIGI